jgi:hypothetical protein
MVRFYFSLMAKVPEILSRFKLNYHMLSMALAAIIMLEGLIIAVMARRIDLIENWGTGLFQSTVALAGVQLFLLGFLVFLCMVINSEILIKVDAICRLRNVLFRDRGFLYPVLTAIPIIIGAAVAVEGIVVAYYASPMVVSGIGGVRGMWLAAFGAQLFFLGSALVTVRLFDGRIDRPALVRSAVLLLFASFGVLVYGLADRATITDFGVLSEGTVELIGAQMAVIALAAIALMWLDGRSFLRRKFLGWEIGTLGVIGLSIVLCFEGLVIASVAAPFTIRSMGNISGWVMLLAGVVLAVLAMIVPATYYLMEKRDRHLMKLGYASMLFLIFMLPFAILM